MFSSKLFLVVLVIKNVLGANILYVSPIASPSHHIWNKALSFGLLEKGHNITMITHETEKGPLPKNFTILTMEGFYEEMLKIFSMEDFVEESALGMMMTIYDFSLFSCRYDYDTAAFKTLFDYPQDYKFDLIIFDNAFGTRCYYPIIERFHNPPSLAVTPFLLPSVLSTVFGNHIYTSYNPYYNTQFTNKMSFSERVINFVFTYAETLYRYYIYLPREDSLIKESFKGYKIDSEELERNVSLLLCNTDPILDYPVALPPNIIPVGGLHAHPSKKLPKDLQVILDEAKQGAILFSLGTNVRSDQLDINTRKAFLDAFAKLPHLVIWKFETDEIEGLPKNVVVRKWLPQNDILGHPNIKLFISHGGALSTQEAMYHGVPVVGIPFMADQYVNVRKMEERKIAKGLDRKNLTTDYIYETVKEVLYSDEYSKNMQDISRQYHDQPQTALERGIFWIEYLVRHGTVEHLVLPARDMPVYQTSNLDVAAVLALCLVLLYSLVLFLVTCCKLIFSFKNYDTTKKTSK